jgi:hypothetical protein
VCLTSAVIVRLVVLGDGLLRGSLRHLHAVPLDVGERVVEQLAQVVLVGGFKRLPSFAHVEVLAEVLQSRERLHLGRLEQPPRDILIVNLILVNEVNEKSQSGFRNTPIKKAHL